MPTGRLNLSGHVFLDAAAREPYRQWGDAACQTAQEVGEESSGTKSLRHPVTSNGPWAAFRQPTRLMGGHCHRASTTSGRGRYMRSAAYQMPCRGVGSQLDSRSGPGESGCR